MVNHQISGQTVSGGRQLQPALSPTEGLKYLDLCMLMRVMQ